MVLNIDREGWTGGHTGQKLISFYHESPSFNLQSLSRLVAKNWYQKAFFFKNFLRLCTPFWWKPHTESKVQKQKNSNESWKSVNLEVNFASIFWLHLHLGLVTLIPTFPINGSEMTIWWVFSLSRSRSASRDFSSEYCIVYVSIKSKANLGNLPSDFQPRRSARKAYWTSILLFLLLLFFSFYMYVVKVSYTTGASRNNLFRCKIPSMQLTANRAVLFVHNRTQQSSDKNWYALLMKAHILYALQMWKKLFFTDLQKKIYNGFT